MIATAPVAFNEHNIIANVTRSSYFEFLKEFWDCFCAEKPYWNWHIELICNELQEVAERVFRGEKKQYDLLINICPGSTKSSAASVAFVPWCWTRMPSLRSINGSHTHELVMDLSRKARDIILSEKYQDCFPNIHLREDQNTKNYFMNNKGGSRFSCTVGGKTPTGMHGHIHVVDDPIDPQKARSDAEIDMADSWMNETLSTRKVDKAITPLILIMQRLSQNDPSGMLLDRDKGRGKVRHICLPAEITVDIKPPHLKRFYKDGLMDPVRIPWHVLEEEQEKGDYYYGGQFLQNPIPLGGGMFKTSELRFADEAPSYVRFKKIIRYWDNAGTPGTKKTDKRRAYTVGIKMGLHKDGTFWILDVKRGRYRTEQREELKRATAYADGQYVKIVQEQEGGSGGQEQMEHTVRMLAGFSITVDRPKGDKALRADPFARQVNTGNVFLVKAPWNNDYIEEMKHYPFSTFKDQIDGSSGAFNTIFRLRNRIGAY